MQTQYYFQLTNETNSDVKKYHGDIFNTFSYTAFLLHIWKLITWHDFLWLFINKCGTLFSMFNTLGMHLWYMATPLLRLLTWPITALLANLNSTLYEPRITLITFLYQPPSLYVSVTGKTLNNLTTETVILLK